MIEIIIIKGKGNEKRDSQIFNDFVGIAKTVFGKNGLLPLPEETVKVSMVRKKHFSGYYTDVWVLIGHEHEIPFETLIAIQKRFNELNKSASMDVMVATPEKNYCTKF